jgi:hypothetical protein
VVGPVDQLTRVAEVRGRNGERTQPGDDSNVNRAGQRLGFDDGALPKQPRDGVQGSGYRMTRRTIQGASRARGEDVDPVRAQRGGVDNRGVVGQRPVAEQVAVAQLASKALTAMPSDSSTARPVNTSVATTCTGVEARSRRR